MVPWWTLLLACLSPLASIAVGAAMVLTNRRGQNLDHADHVAEMAQHQQNGGADMLELPVLDLTAASMRVWMSPFHDTQAAYLEFLRSAERSIHINIFGFHIPELTDELIAAHQRGVIVDAIFDHSQAQGTAEAAEIAKLQAAGVPFLIGTSPRHGQLLHLKATVVDEARVEAGSWNYSESASDQLNDLTVIEDVHLAHFYLLAHDIVRAFILRHERIFQPQRELVPDAATAEGADVNAADPAPDAGQVHRKDLAAPWLDNQPLPSPAPASVILPAQLTPAKPKRSHKKRIAVAVS